MWPAPDGLDPAVTFPGDHIRTSLETSLRASGLEAFDVVQFHVWSDEWVGRGDWLETVLALRDEGKLRFFGVSINDYQPENVLALIESGHVDTVQAIYNVFHQAPRELLLPACAEHSTFPEGDFRRAYFRGDRPAQVERRVNALVHDLGIEPDRVAEIALRYVLSHPAVSTVIPGMRSVRNVERNAAIGDAGPLTGDQLDVLDRHRWERNFYTSA